MPATLIYDGQCPRCTRLARSLENWAQGALKALPMDAPGAMEVHPGLDYAKALKAPHLVLENGYLCAGAEAGANALALRRGWGWLKVAFYLPLIRQASVLAYRLFFSPPRSTCAACP